jgi:hypothetical protein
MYQASVLDLKGQNPMYKSHTPTYRQKYRLQNIERIRQHDKEYMRKYRNKHRKMGWQTYGLLAPAELIEEIKELIAKRRTEV